MPKSPPRRRQRRRGDLPIGFEWRDGRPRWRPSPTRRRQGWRGCDLKDGWGGWLGKGAAIDRASQIAAAVAAWRAGGPISPAFAPFAPRDAMARTGGASGVNPRSIGAMLDAYFASAHFVPSAAKGRLLGERTQADYRNKLRRFLETVAGSSDPAKVAKLKGVDIDCLLPPGPNDRTAFLIERAYDDLCENAGEAMGYGVLACVSAWLNWCVKKRRIWPTNPAALVERRAPDGRIVLFDWAELVAIVRTADAQGLASIGDAVILAVDLSWSEQDLLALTWGQVAPDGRVKHRRIKTGVAGNPPLLGVGRARLEAVRRRWRDERVRPTHVLICEMTGRPWSADTFRHKFSQIRAAAAKGAPAIAGKQFRDLRDTAITYCIEAGLTLEETCSRTLHAPARAQAVITKHYGAIRQGVADAGAEKLQAHFARMGYSFDAPLALPAPGRALLEAEAKEKDNL